MFPLHKTKVFGFYPVLPDYIQQPFPKKEVWKH